MQIRDIAISNRTGLHARACAKVVQIASRFRCDIWVSVRGRKASARSIVALLLLSASVGSVARIEIEGPDENRAMREIVTLFDERFGERS